MNPATAPLRRLTRVVTAAALFGAVALASPAPTASAAEDPPDVYTVSARSFTSHWYGFATLPVDAWTPLAQGSINNLPFADADARLVDPGLLVGSVADDAAKSYTCHDQDPADYDAPEDFPVERVDVPDEACRRTAFPSARSEFPTPDPTISGQQDAGLAIDAASGQEVGRIRAVTGCLDASCKGGRGRVRSMAQVGAGEAGLTGYVRIGAAYAYQEVTADESGVLIGRTWSELEDLVIGPPEARVRIDALRTEIRVSGREDDGDKTVEGTSRITGMTVMGTPIEVTRRGLRVADSVLPTAMAYEQAQAVLDALEEQGVLIEVPDHDAVAASRSEGVVEGTARGLTVHFLTDFEPVDLPEGDLPVVEGPETDVPELGKTQPKVGGHIGGPTAPPPHAQRVDLGYSQASLTARAGSGMGSFVHPGGDLGPPGSLFSQDTATDAGMDGGGGVSAASGTSTARTPSQGESAAPPEVSGTQTQSRFTPLGKSVADRIDLVMLGLLLAGLTLPAARWMCARTSALEGEEAR